MVNFRKLLIYYMANQAVEEVQLQVVSEPQSLKWKIPAKEIIEGLNKGITEKSRNIFSRSIKYIVDKETHKAFKENLDGFNGGDYEKMIFRQIDSNISARFVGENHAIKTIAYNLVRVSFLTYLGRDRNAQGITSSTVENWVIQARKLYDESLKPERKTPEVLDIMEQ